MAIYKDVKRNTWYFRIYVEDKSGIKKQKTRSGFKTKSACIQAQSNFLLNYNLSNDDILFIELYNDYINYKHQNLKYQSYRTIKNKFENHILPFFKDYRINSIKAKDYILWKDYILSKNFKYKTNCSLHLCMVNILNFAYDFYSLKENIASKVGNFSKRDYNPNVINFWTIDEFNQFIKFVDDEVYYSLFNVLYYTGMRLGECLALNWSDLKDNYISIDKTLIRTNNGLYSFNTPKTNGSFRIIQLDNITYNILLSLKEYYKKIIGFNENWLIFGGIRPLSTTTIERKKNKYCKLAGVKQIRIHDFRHSHATMLISNKVPVTVVSKRLGHSDISMTLNTYSHFVPQDEDKAIILLNKIKNQNK